jgi:hypothetical protein
VRGYEGDNFLHVKPLASLVVTLQLLAELRL